MHTKPSDAATFAAISNQVQGLGRAGLAVHGPQIIADTLTALSDLAERVAALEAGQAPARRAKRAAKR